MHTNTHIHFSPNAFYPGPLLGLWGAKSLESELNHKINWMKVRFQPSGTFLGNLLQDCCNGKGKIRVLKERWSTNTGSP